MKELKEGDLRFTFSDGIPALKYDETRHFQAFKDSIVEGKGVDLLFLKDDTIGLVEIKDFSGSESQASVRYRIRKGLRAGIVMKDGYLVEEDSLDIEVSQKAAHTLALLYGVATYPKYSKESAEEFEPFLITRPKIQVILFLEGNLGSDARSKKMIMKNLQDAIKKRMENWIYIPKIQVVDSQTYTGDLASIFTVRTDQRS